MKRREFLAAVGAVAVGSAAMGKVLPARAPMRLEKCKFSIGTFPEEGICVKFPDGHILHVPDDLDLDEIRPSQSGHWEVSITSLEASNAIQR